MIDNIDKDFFNIDKFSGASWKKISRKYPWVTFICSILLFTLTIFHEPVGAVLKEYTINEHHISVEESQQVEKDKAALITKIEQLFSSYCVFYNFYISHNAKNDSRYSTEITAWIETLSKAKEDVVKLTRQLHNKKEITDAAYNEIKNNLTKPISNITDAEQQGHLSEKDLFLPSTEKINKINDKIYS
jgi:hypothetical protein